MKNLVLNLSKKARAQRAGFFRRTFTLSEATRIIDIGSETGSNINSVLENTAVRPENVYIADINAEDLKKGHENFGFQTVLLDESGKLPFEDKFFDIVYCSSVIEHVTVPKEDIWTMTSGEKFKALSLANQKNFAVEIGRVAKGYIVQTPNKNFIVESHTWLPFFGYLPRYLMVKLMPLVNKVWVKPSIPDYHLLNVADMKWLFPEAEIVFERKFGMIKSIMAIKRGED